MAATAPVAAFNKVRRSIGSSLPADLARGLNPGKELDISRPRHRRRSRQLENALYRDHPETAQTNVYYPASEDRARARDKRRH
ncbi:hypothetical protein GCM10023324_38250 [Streptomyces youssoufiensis]